MKWILLAVSLVAAPPRTADPIRLDGVAAHVNESTITVGEVMFALEPVRRRLVQEHAGARLREELQAAYDGILDRMIDNRLILAAFEDSSGQLPEWAVDQRVSEVIHEVFQGDRARLMETLTSEHRTFDDWREDIRHQIIVSSMRSAHVSQNIRITPGQVQAAYRERIDEFRTPAKVKLRMIMLEKGTGEAEAGTKRKQAEEIRRRLLAGADFAAIARKESEGGKGEQGGDWGWVEPAMLRKELADVAGTLAVATVSEIIETDGEFYILEVQARKQAAVKPLREVQPELERELRQAEGTRLFREWTDRLRKNAYVKVFDVDLF
jgi:peptidyl-prolyl cis-trans isomerase SurA